MDNSTSFDPFTQSFNLSMADGTPIEITLDDLDSFILYSIQICINFAAQLGASLVLLIVLLLLTKPDKRRAPIFITNTLSLVINFIRNILQCLYFTGPFNDVYAYFAQDYSNVHRNDYGISVTATVLTLLLLICVETSLIFQVRVVSVTLRRIYRRAIMAVAILVALIAVAFRFALCVENSIYIVTLKYLTGLTRLESAATITTTVSICFFCAVFVIKLAIALHQRKKLGLGQFGPMQIIFIMGCQTLVIPAIFSILQYVVDNPAMSSNVLTLCAIFLPLSSLWASANLSSRSQPSININMPNGAYSSAHTGGSSRPLVGEKNRHGTLSPTNTDMTSASKMSKFAGGDHADIYRDLESQDLDDEKHH